MKNPTIGTRVKFLVSRDSEEYLEGTIIDVLSTQFIILDDENNTYVTRFENVKAEPQTGVE
jgi:hypothetical protein